MLPHWDYYLALEDDLAKCSRYVAPEGKNLNTYSIEFAKIILQAGSEVELVAKELCIKIDPKISNRQLRKMKINDFYPIILNKYPNFKKNILSIPDFNMKNLKPWLGWQKNRPPAWWTAYNAAKHHRGERFSRASFKNAIYSVSGLLVIIMYLWKELFGEIMQRDDDHAVPNLIMPHDFAIPYSVVLEWALAD